MKIEKENIRELPILWEDRKRTLFGLPWSFTRYSLTAEALTIKKGFFSIEEDDVKLYRILDLTLKQSLGQRIFGVGTIHCCSSDKTLKDFDIKSVKVPKDVKALLSQSVETERENKRISGREFLSDDEHDEEDY